MSSRVIILKLIVVLIYPQRSKPSRERRSNCDTADAETRRAADTLVRSHRVFGAANKFPGAGSCNGCFDRRRRNGRFRWRSVKLCCSARCRWCWRFKLIEWGRNQFQFKMPDLRVFGADRADIVAPLDRDSLHRSGSFSFLENVRRRLIGSILGGSCFGWSLTSNYALS